MNKILGDHFQNVIQHLYINPLERCNLHCKICYTRKTAPKLTEQEIIDFITRYQKAAFLKVITFCGGEVMLLPYFPQLVNQLNELPRRNVRHTGHPVDPPAGGRDPMDNNPPLDTVPSTRGRYDDAGSRGENERGLFVQIITNGTIDRLEEFAYPNLVNLIVSIDGLEEYHDSNRGKGNFKKSLDTLQKAISMGFHHEIFSVVTSDNFADIEKFEKYIQDTVGKTEITYHPRKPPAYLANHPQSNMEGKVEGFGYVTPEQLTELYKSKNVFPPKNLGCYQISLVSDGKVYGCCEGAKPIGHMNDDITILIHRLRERVESDISPSQNPACLGCSQPDFMCGIMEIIFSDQAQDSVIVRAT